MTDLTEADLDPTHPAAAAPVDDSQDESQEIRATDAAGDSTVPSVEEATSALMDSPTNEAADEAKVANDVQHDPPRDAPSSDHSDAPIHTADLTPRIVMTEPPAPASRPAADAASIQDAMQDSMEEPTQEPIQDPPKDPSPATGPPATSPGTSGAVDSTSGSTGRWSPRRSRIVAFMNQKGGVGKTTTTVNLGAALAEAGSRVLLIDLDPQAHMTLHVGVDPESLESSVYDVLLDEKADPRETIQQVGDNLWVLPAETSLAGIESELAPRMVDGRAQRALLQRCRSMLNIGPDGMPGDDCPYDFIFMDCPPSLGLLTINGLILAREVIVPMQAHFLALQGLSKLLETINLMRQGFNPSLTVSGIALCMHERQTILANEIVADLTSFIEQSRGTDAPWAEAELLQPFIRRNIKLAEGPSFGQTIFQYEPTCAGAQDYRAMAQSVLAQSVRRG